MANEEDLRLQTPSTRILDGGTHQRVHVKVPSPVAGIWLGAIALGSGFITFDALKACLAEQGRISTEGAAPIPLGELLLLRGYLTPPRLRSLLELQTILNQNTVRGTAGTPVLHREEGPGEGDFFDKFRIVRRVGHGGMGVVYEAIDTVLERRVALKVLDKAGSGFDREGEQRFLREARVVALLAHHPHIVEMYEAGKHDGWRFMAMQFIDGQPMLEGRASVGEDRLLQVRILRDVALAVHHAHEHGVIHRDLKPVNILVDLHHQPHVTDFGLAKALYDHRGVSLTGSGTILGTPCYMSPEQARGDKEVDSRCDIYALGVILYEILAGRPPFREPSVMAILSKVMGEAPLAPSAVALSEQGIAVDGRIEETCLRAIAKDPAARHTDAMAFARELSAWLEASAPVRG